MNPRYKVEHVRHHHGLIGVIALTLFIATPALAQDSERDRKLMLKLSEEAAEAFKADDFEKAAKLFAKARNAYPDNLLTMNEMIAWYKADRCDKALVTSGLFLKDMPDDPKDPQNQADRMSAHRVEFECRVKASEVALADGRRDDAIKFATMAELVYDAHEGSEEGDFGEADKSRLETLAADIEAAGKATPPDDVVEPDPDPVEPTEDSGGLTAVGWVGVGGLAVGAGLLGYSAFLYSDNIEDIDKYREVCGDPAADPVCQREEELSQARQAHTVTLIAGGTLAAVGVGLLVYDLVSGGESDSTGAKVVPVIGAEGGGVQVLFSF